MKKLLLFPFLLLPVGASEPMIQRFAADWRLLSDFQRQTGSAEATQRLHRFYQAKLKELEQVDFQALNRPGQIDHILLRSAIEQEERVELPRNLARQKEMEPFLPFVKTVRDLDLRRREVTPPSDEDAAKAVASLLEQVKAGRKHLDQQLKPGAKPDKQSEEETDEEPEEETGEEAHLEKKTPAVSKVQALRMANAVKRSREKLEGWYKHYAAYRPGFEWWVKQPFEASKKSLNEYEKHLREKIAGAKEGGPLIGEPVGAARLRQLLDGEFIPYSAEELIRIGEREFAWCREQGDRAAKEIDCDTWLEGLEKIKGLHVAPGEQDQLVARYAHEAMAFLDERKLITVPALCRDLWDVNMIEAKVQKKIPYAMYGGNRIMVAYAANSMNHEHKEMAMRGNNLHTTRIVVAHEAVPGHHLQRFMAQRHRPYRGIFSTPFFVEGWALYWEIRLWDLEFARSPEDQLGMLFWRMHRCARIIVSLKFHLGEMTPKEMVDFLVDEVGHEREQATAEVRRYIDENTGPLYQAAYMLGGIQLKNLREELVPEKMSEKQFHDRVLRLGPIPVELIRASLDEEIKLIPDYRSQWRFDD